MIQEVFMPALSSTMTEGKIVSWNKSPGEKVAKGETILVVESDKADMDVESFYEGYLATITVEAGESAPVGSTIALIAETEAEIETARSQSPSTSKTKTAPAEIPNPSPEANSPIVTPKPVAIPSNNGNGRQNASPKARKLAKELGVDWKSLQGSGPHGRVVVSDVEQAVGKTTPKTQPTPQTQVAKTVSPVSTSTQGELVSLNTLQQAVVRNMVASLEVPVFHVSYTITTDALDTLYRKIKSKGVTMTALLAKAVAITLQKYPILNASYTNSGIQYHSDSNIAIAVAMPDGGLITPVLTKAADTDIYSLSRTWKILVDKARAKQLQPEEYNSGTFTLSNLGMFGVERFDAILPPGQGSILAIGASRPQVIATPEGMMAVRSQMNVNITCDHRIIYGADAAAFLQDLANLIENDTHSLTL